MAHDLFISYSTQDKPTADAACATLEAAGIRCWIAPRDIVPGAEWGEAIVSAIADCRAMILIFSASANDSPQIRREVERAVSKGIPIIPLRIEDIAPTRSLEYFIGTVHWLDALTPPLENHLRRLTDTAKALLHVPTAAPDIAEKLSAPVIAPPSPARRPAPAWLPAGAAALLVLAALAVGWWFYSAKAPAPEAARAPPAPSAAIALQSETAPAKSSAAQAPAAPAPSATAVASETPPAKSTTVQAPAAAGSAASQAPSASPPPSVAAAPSEPSPAKTSESTLPAAAREQILAPPPDEPAFVRVPVQVARAPASASVPATRHFDNPMVDGVALDHCRSWARDCGQPAADAFCQSQGFAAAIDFTRQPHAPPTRVISSGQVCNGANCARITAVTCGNAAVGETPPGPARQAALEYGVNRVGSDMRGLVLPGGTPEQCRDACLADMSCRAFTFVNPGIQGPSARCWLKHAVPQASSSPCCVSGVPH
ncbi:MAG TPA: TIR domain-containing protein [Alphaproteobacteria bacterium]|nr:TIR domain-containing protein [Alphaproteobacteria bacterium]